MGIFVQIGIGALVAYLISNAFDISFWLTAVGIGLLYLSWRNGWFGGATTATRTGGGMFGGMWSMVVSITVFTGLVMVATRFIGVSNNYTTHQMVVLGWRPWLWPQGLAIDLLLWVSVAFIAAWIAGRAAHGNAKIAGIIFGTAAIIIFGMMWLPNTTRNVVPVGSNAWAETDANITEAGVVSVATQATTRLVTGKPTDLETNGVVGSSARRAWRFLFGTSAQRAVAKLRSAAPATRSTMVYVRASASAASTRPKQVFHPFSTDGCYETDLGYETQWEPKDMGMRVHDPSGNSHVERLGTKSPVSAFGPGHWRFCAEDPGATGVVIWE